MGMECRLQRWLGLAGGRGLLESGPSEEPARSSHGQAGAGMTRFLGTKEAMTLPAAAALIPGSPREGTEAPGPRKPAVAVPTLGLPPADVLI